jgi:hypothetical protein
MVLTTDLEVEMFKYMWNKNKALMKIAIILIIGILIMGVLLIVDSIQKANRSSSIVGDTLIENDGQINAYDVDGLTDEQIEELLTDTVRQMKIGSMYDKKPRDE